MARKKQDLERNIPDDLDATVVVEEFREIYLDLVTLSDAFCDEQLNEEYKELCRTLAADVCSPDSPVAGGKRDSWASGIVYTAGRVNFLGDASFEPHMRSEDIAKQFGISVATMQSKSKIIREGLDIMSGDPKYTLPSRLDDNLLVWLIEVNGFIMDVRRADLEVQQIAFEKGLIPYIPADKKSTDDTYDVTHQRVPYSEVRETESMPRDDLAYEIKVTLDNITPPIWRRVRVPDCSLDDLHDVIQDVMGWHDGHMHEFHAGDVCFHMDEAEDYGGVDKASRNESDVLLSEVVEMGHKTLKYWYDFGDDWRHTIKIEKTLNVAPEVNVIICLKGARACPPEDVGGPWGYENFLDAISDPDHEQHEMYSEWFADGFDPEQFDAQEINELLASE